MLSGLLQFAIAAIQVFIVGHVRDHRCWVSPTSLIEVLAKRHIEVPALESNDQVMKDNTASNEHDSPFMLLGRCDLNTEFTEGLEAAFEQANCVFRADADLAIENHKKRKKKDEV